jgi:hypothetical protein
VFLIFFTIQLSQPKITVKDADWGGNLNSTRPLNMNKEEFCALDTSQEVWPNVYSRARCLFLFELWTFGNCVVYLPISHCHYW